MIAIHRVPMNTQGKPPIRLQLPTRRPLVCEFRHVFLPQPSRVIVDFDRAVVGFVHCHQCRPKSFWSMPFRSPDEYFECPLSDILEAFEIRHRGASTFNIVTTDGRAAVPEAMMLKKTRNYEQLKEVLSRIARSTPSAPFWQSASMGYLVPALVIGVAWVIFSVIYALS